MAKKTAKAKRRTKGHPAGPKYYSYLSRKDNRALQTLTRQGRIEPARGRVSRLQNERLRAEMEEIARRDNNYKGRLVWLKVKIGNQRVCFKCLEPFTADRPVDRHHLLPWRFHNLADYPDWVPVVEVHRDCTCRWHDKHDPHHWQANLEPFWCCIAESQRLGYGFAIYATDPRRKHLSSLQVSAGLLPFIVGQADQTTPTDKWRSGSHQMISLQPHFHSSDALGSGRQERSTAALLPPQRISKPQPSSDIVSYLFDTS